MSLRVGSLFSGVEGFGQGLEAAGFEVAWQVEIDRDAVSVLERHYPTVRRYRDVREVKGSELDPVDVLVGGFPCQDLSVAGARKGLAGERSGLFFEVARIAAETATPWLLLENVPGLLSSFTPVEPPPSDVPPGTEWTVEETSDLGVVLSTLAEHGYGFCTRTLDAQHFGVPQRRERVFIVGCLGDTGARAGSVLLESESVLWDLATCFQSREGIAGLPENGAGNGGVACDIADTLSVGANQTTGFVGDVVAHVAKTLQANSGRCQVGMNYVAGTLAPGTHPGGWDGHSAYIGHLLPVGIQGVGIANALNTHRRDDGSAETFVVGIAQNQRGELRTMDIMSSLTNGGGKPGEGYPAVMAFDWQVGTGNPCVSEAVTPALQAGKGHAVTTHALTASSGATEDGTGRGTPLAASHGGTAVRRLMPVECERLMGWADSWTERRADGSLIPDGPRYRMIGNGVVAPVARWIGERLRRAMERAS